MELNANRLGEMLLEAGLIDQFQLESALSMQRNLGGRIGSALVKLGYLPEETILEFLETQAKYARISLRDLELSSELMKILPPERMLERVVIPVELRKIGNEKALRVAMTDPTNLQLIEELQFSTGCRILPVVAGEEEIIAAINSNLPPEPLVEDEDLAGPATENDDFVTHNMIDLGDFSTDDPRLDRLLDLLQKKGILSAIDVERVKFN